MHKQNSNTTDIHTHTSKECFIGAIVHMYILHSVLYTISSRTCITCTPWLNMALGVALGTVRLAAAGTRASSKHTPLNLRISGTGGRPDNSCKHVTSTYVRGVYILSLIQCIHR